jgi:hypothetical protein
VPDFSPLADCSNRNSFIKDEAKASSTRKFAMPIERDLRWPKGGQERRLLPREDAEQLAISCLGLIAEEPETLGRFLSVTGLGPETLRNAASEPGFLAAVIEYMLSDESLLLTASERFHVRPTLFAAARHELGRGLDE